MTEQLLDNRTGSNVWKRKMDCVIKSLEMNELRGNKSSMNRDEYGLFDDIQTNIHDCLSTDIYKMTDSFVYIIENIEKTFKKNNQTRMIKIGLINKELSKIELLNEVFSKLVSNICLQDDINTKYIVKLLKLLNVDMIQYNEHNIIFENCAKLYLHINNINSKLKLFAGDIILNGDQYLKQYDQSQNNLLSRGYFRNLRISIFIPSDIQYIIYKFMSCGIQVDVFDTLCSLSTKHINSTISKTIFNDKLPAWITGCFSNQKDVQYKYIKKIRRALSIKSVNLDLFIQPILGSGIISKLKEIINVNDGDMDMINEACLILINLCLGSSEYALTVIRSECIELIINLLFKSASTAASISASDCINYDILYPVILGIRKILSVSVNPPIQQIIDTGIMPYLIACLKMNNYPQIQFESAWILTNIASGDTENTQQVIDIGAIPLFIELLNNNQSSYNIQNQVIWALGNIAGDSCECRNLVLQHKVMNNLLKICSNWKNLLKQETTCSSNTSNMFNDSPLSLLKNVSWVLSNFCRGKPQPEHQYIKLIVECFTHLINIPDDEIYSNFGWAFSYLTSCIYDDNPLLKIMADDGITSKLIHLLDYKDYKVQQPALRSIGNIATCSDIDTEFIISCGVLDKISSILLKENENKNLSLPIRREMYWMISNITAGNDKQIESVIESKLFPLIITVLQNDKYDVAKEALWAISNATSGGTQKQIKYLVNLNIIPVIISFISKIGLNLKLLLVTLECIENILYVGDQYLDKSIHGTNKYVDIIEQCGGLDVLQELQNNENMYSEVYNKIPELISKYWSSQHIDNDVDCNEINIYKNNYTHKLSFMYQLNGIYKLNNLIYTNYKSQAWRYDDKESKWKHRGKGEINVYYDALCGLTKIIFKDKNHDNRVRLLQYIDSNIIKMFFIDNETIGWYGCDYSINDNPMFSKWKLRIKNNPNAAKQFLNAFDQSMHQENNVKSKSNKICLFL